MLFEHMDTDLTKFLRFNRNLPRNYIKHIFRQIVTGVDHMHRNLIMHRDLKSSNILINIEDLQVKVADLGLAVHFNVPFDKYDTQIGKTCLPE